MATDHMTFFLIDPAERSICLANNPDSNPNRIADAFITGARFLDMAKARIDGHAVAFMVDDDGMGKRLPAFEVEGYGAALYGRAVVFGVNMRNGFTIGCPVTIDRLRSAISWVES